MLLLAWGDFFCDILDHFIQAFLDLGADGNDLEFWEAGLEGFEVLFGLMKVHFISNDARRLGCECGIVEAQFLAERLIVVNWIPAFAASHVEDKEEGFAANDVAQELVTEAAIFVGTLDQTGDVRHGGATVFRKVNDTDQWMQRGERIGRRLGLRGREFAEECGFSCVRISHQADVGNRPELK